MKFIFAVLALAVSAFAAPDILDLGVLPPTVTKAQDPICPATAVAKAGCAAKYQKVQCGCTEIIAGVQINGKCGHLPAVGPMCVPTALPVVDRLPGAPTAIPILSKI